MVFGRTPIRYMRQLAQRDMPESVSVIKTGTTYDPYGGVIYGDPYVAYTTKGAFRTATAQEVANHQRLDERVDGVLSLAVGVAPFLNTDDRLYRSDTGETYEITGIRRSSAEYEPFIQVLVRQADPEREYQP